MLPKKERLTTEEFMVVMEKGRVSHSPLFLVRSLQLGEKSSPAKFAAVAPKKVAKTAVARNKIRRQIYEAIKIALVSAKVSGKETGNFHAAVFAKETVVKANQETRVADLGQLFVKAGIIK